MAGDPADIDLTPLTAALSKLAEDMARKMVQDALPGLVEKAVAEEKVLINETVQEMTRQALPDLLKPIVDQLAQDIIDKVAREIVPDHAEAAVKKEIERLTAEV
jgi:DNA-binding FrmR family transcriptional regulator